MNVLILTDEYYPYHIGGAGVVASQINQALGARNIKCRINCSNPKNGQLKKIFNVIWPVWALFVYLFSLFQKNDIIIVNDLRSAYILGLIGNKKILSKCVYIIHGTEVDIVFRSRSKKNSLILLPLFYSNFLKHCKKVIYVSQYVASRVADEFQNRKIKPKCEVVSYAGLNADMQDLVKNIIELSAQKIFPIRLVSFSRLEKRKGYLDMVAIFETLIKSGHDLTWDIYGKGSLENEIANMINDKKLSNRVRMMGKLERNMLSNNIEPNSYDAYWLLPNKPEAFGLTFIESAAAGVPTFGPDKYGVTEAICENQSGFFYKNNEKFISDLVNIKKNKREFMMSCKRWASKFNVESFINDILN